MNLSKNNIKIKNSGLIKYNNFLKLFLFNVYFLRNAITLNSYRQHILKKYFNIFLKFNFFIFKNEAFYNFNFYLIQRYKAFNSYNIVLLYWSYYFNQLYNLLNLFYYLSFNSINYYFITSQSKISDVVALNWLNLNSKILYTFLNFFKMTLKNLKKFNFILFLKKFLKKYKIQALILLDFDLSNFFFNLLIKLKINVISIFKFNTNLINCGMYSNFIPVVNYLNFYRLVLINFFYDIYILAQFIKFITFFKKWCLFFSKSNLVNNFINTRNL